MATKIGKRGGFARAAVSIVASATLALSMVPAAAFGATYTAPTEAKDGTTTNDAGETVSYIKCAAHAAAEPIAYLLGLDNTTYRTSSFTYDVNDYDSVSSLTRLGIFGSSMNENADTFLWNMFYNAYATANDLETTEYVPKTISGGGPNGADSTGASIYWRPETICGISSSNMASSYEAQVAAVDENLDDDTTNDYDPYLVAYDMSGLTTMIETTYALAYAAEDAIEDSDGTKTSRYNDGDVVQSAEDYESIILSTQYYILSQIDAGAVERRTYVYVDSIDTDTYKFAVSLDSPDTFETSSSTPGRLMAGIQNCTDNLANLLIESGAEVDSTTTTSDRDGSTSTTYYLTAEQLMQADVVIYTGGGVSTGGGGNDSSTDTSSNAIAEVLAAAGYTDSSAYPSVFTSMSDPVGVLNSNGVENALAVPEVLGFIYNDVIDQMDLVGWYFKNLYHVTDSSLQAAIDGACEGMTCADDLTVADGYETRVEEAFAIGDAYYEANAEAIVAEYPNLVSYEDYVDSLSVISDDTVELAESAVLVSYDDDGAAETQWPSVVYNGETTLTQTSDFTARYYDSDGNRVYAISEIGLYTVEVTGIDNYTGTATLTYAVVESLEDYSSGYDAGYTAGQSAASKTVDETSASYEAGYEAGYEAAAAAAEIEICSENVTLSKTSYTYNGKARKPSVTVSFNGTAIDSSLYTVAYASGRTKVGTYSVTVTANEGSGYTGTVTKTFKITKASQTLTVKKATKTVKYAKVKKSKQTVKAITKVSGAKGTVTYTKTSGSKKITVNSKTGKITVKKGTAKGTYKIKVKVKSAATTNYKAASKTVTVTVKVK